MFVSLIDRLRTCRPAVLWASAALSLAVSVAVAQPYEEEALAGTGTVEFQERSTWEFPQDGVTFTNDFSGARLNGLRRARARRYAVTISPENHPINNSAWYCFMVTAERPVSITITLNYENGRHRYSPHISRDGRSWVKLPDSQVTVRGREQAILSLDLQPGPLWIAGQPLITWEEQMAWAEELAGREGRTLRSYGQSVQGRPLVVLETGKAGPDAPTMIVITGQHPPEFSSIYGFRAFIEVLLSDEPRYVAFRERFNLAIFPNLNPDGWFHGHWRSNVMGQDLNRAWLEDGLATGPEVQQTIAVLRALNKPVGFLDFHSTRRNVFYTGGDDEGQPHGLVGALIDGMNARLEERDLETWPRSIRRGNRGSNSQHWVRREMDVAAAIWEFDDHVSAEHLRYGPRAGAEAMVEFLMQWAGESVPAAVNRIAKPQGAEAGS